MMRTIIMVSGEGTNLQAVIDAALPGIEIIGIVSDNPKAFGLTRAAKMGIPAFAVDYKSFDKRSNFDKALFETIQELNPDLIVLAGFMRILADGLVAHYHGRMINIHPSLLPEYPGLNTYNRALNDGAEWHGATVHFVIPKLDAGPAIIQYRVRIQSSDTAISLAKRVQQGEYLIYPKAIAMLSTGQIYLQNSIVYKNGRILAIPEIVNEPEQD